MMDEELRQTMVEVREMKQMCGNINMKLTNIVTQRGQDLKKKLEAEYQRGLDDAWECARKLFSSMADSDIEKAFPVEWNNGGFNALINLQPQEAIAKLKVYEEKQKADDDIKAGDIVYLRGDKYIVSYINDDECADLIHIWSGSTCARVSPDCLTRTGKHYDIDKILEEMKS